MNHYFGNVMCPHCEKENRVLIEENYSSDNFLMVGDKIIQSVEALKKETQCEYCFGMFVSKVIEKDGIFSAILNEKQCEAYEKDTTLVKKAEEGTGMKHEQELEMLFAHTFDFSFDQQPFKPKQHIYLLDKKWTVMYTYKKEHTERDLEKRMEIEFVDSYYYEIESENGDKKWLHVVDDEKENATLSDVPPVVLEFETLYNIDSNSFKKEHIYTQELGIQYELHFYQQLSGVQMLVIRKDEETSVIVLDALGESIEELLADVEEMLHITD